jgi:uncharacterized repeat protein (TIGR03833 family)
MSSGIVYSTEHGKMCPVCGKPLTKCLCRQKKETPQADGLVPGGKTCGAEERRDDSHHFSWKSAMNGQQRNDIRPGMRVEIILKKDQRTGQRTVGVVKDILTSASYHSRGIKVRLEDGQIGRVQAVFSDAQ